MRDVKRRMENYSFYDRSGIAAHLEAMAAKGWQLEHMTNLIWIYRRSAPQRLRYAVTYYPGGSAYDPEPNPALAEFYELCEHEGWERVAGFAEMNIFVNRRENPTPLETDPAVELGVIERSVRRRLTRPYWIMLVVTALFAFLGLGNLFVDPVYALSGLYSVPAGLCLAFCAAALAVELVGYYRWRSRAHKAAAHGESVETKSPRRVLRILLPCTYAALAFSLLCIFIAGDNLIRFSFALVLVVYAITHVSMQASAGRLKKRGSSKGRTFAVSSVLCFAVAFALYAAAGPLAIDLVRADDVDTNYVNHSLSLSELTGAEMPGYVRTPLDRESVILAQSAVDVGALEYTTTFVKIPALYGFCERTASRGGESVDPAPWGALRAYSMGGDAYTLCYDGRIVEISLPFTPTDEQMAIVDEKLGA